MSLSDLFTTEMRYPCPHANCSGEIVLRRAWLTEGFKSVSHEGGRLGPSMHHMHTHQNEQQII